MKTSNNNTIKVYEVLIKESTGHGKYSVCVTANDIKEAKEKIIDAHRLNYWDVVSVKRIFEN